jgi:hypothetical protein
LGRVPQSKNDGALAALPLGVIGRNGAEVTDDDRVTILELGAELGVDLPLAERRCGRSNGFEGDT